METEVGRFIPSEVIREDDGKTIEPDMKINEVLKDGDKIFVKLQKDAPSFSSSHFLRRRLGAFRPSVRARNFRNVRQNVSRRTWNKRKRNVEILRLRELLKPSIFSEIRNRILPKSFTMTFPVSRDTKAREPTDKVSRGTVRFSSHVGTILRGDSIRV